MRITIHQPEHMPWLGFFNKIDQADAYVVLDSVQFSKNYFQNRNKIRTKEGWSWITVPVIRNSGTLICDVEIAEDSKSKWKRKWYTAISHAYANTPHGKHCLPPIEELFKKDWKYLSEFNIELIKALMGLFRIDTPMVLASQLNASGTGSELILNLCKEMNADTYLSGISGTDYLEVNKFQSSHIAVEFQEFHHPIYQQKWSPFIPCMSAIDLLCNYGDNSLDILRGIGVEKIHSLFL